MEVAGIEPACFNVSVSLLRAQSLCDCRATKGSDTLSVALAVCECPHHPVGTSGGQALQMVAPTPAGREHSRAALTPWGQAASTRASCSTLAFVLVPALLRGSGDHGSLLSLQLSKSKPITPKVVVEVLLRVREAGVEPARSEEHQNLNLAWLPFSPLPHSCLARVSAEHVSSASRPQHSVLVRLPGLEPGTFRLKVGSSAN